VLLAHHIFPAMHWTWHSKEIAHIIGMGVPMFSSFLGHKYLTFGQQSI
jgi:putative flippase GtrA